MLPGSRGRGEDSAALSDWSATQPHPIKILLRSSATAPPRTTVSACYCMHSLSQPSYLFKLDRFRFRWRREDYRSKLLFQIKVREDGYAVQIILLSCSGWLDCEGEFVGVITALQRDVNHDSMASSADARVAPTASGSPRGGRGCEALSSVFVIRSLPLVTGISSLNPIWILVGLDSVEISI